MSNDGPAHTEDRWSKVQRYPVITERSIVNDLPIGCQPGWDPIGFNARTSSAHIWGPLGSGKTVVVADVIAGALQCPDALVWTVGVELAAAFLHPYKQGLTDRPAIDWVAASSDELVKMASAARAIAAERRAKYADLRFTANTHHTPVGDGRPGGAPPHILIVVDDEWLFRGLGEAADKVWETFEQITSMTAVGAVSVVYTSVQRRASTVPAFVRDLPVRIGMRITDEVELKAAFGVELGGRAAPRPYAGTGYLRTRPDGDTQRMRALHLTPQEMHEIAVATAGWRPRMDKVSEAAAGAAYKARWDRIPQALGISRPVDQRI